MTENRLRDILERIRTVRVAVVGDFFLDRYWRIDPTRDEPSIETGLTAYQIVETWNSPGAAGTVTNNLAALGVGRIYAVGFHGLDGEGCELARRLDETDIDRTHLIETPLRATPCYTKPLCNAVEMNRFDIKNRTVTPNEIEDQIISSIRELAGQVDAMLIMDQVGEPDCGVLTTRVRECLVQLGKDRSKPILYADSRERIGWFDQMIVKCNDRELLELFDLYDGTKPGMDIVRKQGIRLADKTGRPVFITLGENGQLVFEANVVTYVPAVRVEGEIDICGAGDASSSAIVASLCAGASCEEAAMLGNLASSVTIRKIGQTGTASPDEIFLAFKNFRNETASARVGGQ